MAKFRLTNLETNEFQDLEMPDGTAPLIFPIPLDVLNAYAALLTGLLQYLSISEMELVCKAAMNETIKVQALNALRTHFPNL